ASSGRLMMASPESGAPVGPYGFRALVAMSALADMATSPGMTTVNSGKELIVGTTSPGSNAHDMPLLLKEFTGANLRLLKGYAANSDILLALERKEVDAWAALATTIKAAADQGAVRALVRARAPVPGFDDLPVDEDLTT